LLVNLNCQILIWNHILHLFNKPHLINCTLKNKMFLEQTAGFRTHLPCPLSTLTNMFKICPSVFIVCYKIFPRYFAQNVTGRTGDVAQW
jgi:hypothetical protein